MQETSEDDVFVGKARTKRDPRASKTDCGSLRRSSGHTKTKSGRTRSRKEARIGRRQIVDAPFKRQRKNFITRMWLDHFVPLTGISEVAWKLFRKTFQ